MASHAERKLQAETKQLDHQVDESLGRTEGLMNEIIGYGEEVNQKLQDQTERLEEIGGKADEVVHKAKRAHSLLNRLSWWACMRPSTTYNRGKDAGGNPGQLAAQARHGGSKAEGHDKEISASEVALQEIEARQEQRQAARNAQAAEAGPIKLTSTLKLMPSGAAEELTPEEMARRAQMDRLDNMASGINRMAMGIHSQLVKQQEVLEEVISKIEEGDDLVQSAAQRTKNIKDRA